MPPKDVSGSQEQLFSNPDIDAGNPSSTNAPSFANVIVPIPGNQGYTYAIPPDLRMDVDVGKFVEVPIGPRVVRGLVWDLQFDTDGINLKRVKSITNVLDVADVPPNLIKLLDWCARYTLTARGNLMRLVQPPKQVLQPVQPKVKFNLNPEAPTVSLSKPRKAFLERVAALGEEAKSKVLSVKEWAELCGVSDTVVRGLCKAGFLNEAQVQPLGAVQSKSDTSLKTNLSKAQKVALAELAPRINSGYSVSLLDGITGSGKTHVYTELVKQTLQAGKSVLVLLPEIALTSDILDRLTAETGVQACPWHSEVTPAAKATIWQLLQNKSNLLVVGARSSLWLPFRNLGLIIVDEEHDGSYKQSEGALYNARDMAIVRAKLEGCPILLSSATPTIETYYHAHQGKYHLSELKERVGEATLPQIKMVDVCKEQLPRGRWISPSIEEQMRESFAQGKQSLLFLNKRGYAPLSLCRACSHRFECRTCSAWLVEHRLKGTLECHHCGFTQKKPTVCPECAEPDTITAVGPGVERLSEEVAKLFPEARIGVGSSDTLYSSGRINEFMTSVKAGEFDILIGTQILAKGHNFPLLETVAIIDADMGLRGGDPRAAEQSFQILTQISGRAGRFGEQGKVFVQTSQPDDPLMVAISKNDRDGFLANEIKKRKFAQLPPFGRLTSLILSDVDPRRVDQVANDLINRAPSTGEKFRILGPAPAPIAVIRGRHRRRFLLQSYNGAMPQPFLRTWLENFKMPASTRLTIDIDPYSFL
ncbi:MAG: replication restart helicase PriA [Alphaproteobacteria bacterium]